jgi:hypothetical protein
MSDAANSPGAQAFLHFLRIFDPTFKIVGLPTYAIRDAASAFPADGLRVEFDEDGAAPSLSTFIKAWGLAGEPTSSTICPLTPDRARMLRHFVCLRQQERRRARMNRKRLHSVCTRKRRR